MAKKKNKKIKSKAKKREKNESLALLKKLLEKN